MDMSNKSEKVTVLRSFEELRQYCSRKGESPSGRKVSEALLSTPVLTEIPLEPRRGSTYRVCCIRFASKGKENMEAILWDCLFGDPRLSHWIFLFNFIDHCTEWTPELQLLFDILMFINDKSTSVAISENILKMRMKSVRQVLGKDLAERIANELRGTILNIPVKKPSLKMFITLEVRRIKRTPESRRIGVGYKDKGHLGVPGSEYDPTDLPKMKADPNIMWSRLLRNFQTTFSRLSDEIGLYP